MEASFRYSIRAVEEAIQTENYYRIMEHLY